MKNKHNMQVGGTHANLLETFRALRFVHRFLHRQRTL